MIMVSEAHGASASDVVSLGAVETGKAGDANAVQANPQAPVADPADAVGDCFRGTALAVTDDARS